MLSFSSVSYSEVSYSSRYPLLMYQHHDLLARWGEWSCQNLQVRNTRKGFIELLGPINSKWLMLWSLVLLQNLESSLYYTEKNKCDSTHRNGSVQSEVQNLLFCYKFPKWLFFQLNFGAKTFEFEHCIIKIWLFHWWHHNRLVKINFEKKKDLQGIFLRSAIRSIFFSYTYWFFCIFRKNSPILTSPQEDFCRNWCTIAIQKSIYTL